MLAFIRGNSTFVGPGQIYVKVLPSGESVELTHDHLNKMSPTFSPDGMRIAYTVVDPKFGWDTWTVPVLDGEPQRLLANASGLVWTGPHEVLFSEIKSGDHMAIVAAEESRVAQRDVYASQRIKTAWLTGRTRHPMGNGCFWSKWTRTIFGHRAAWFLWTDDRRAARSAHPVAAVPLAHGRPMASGCISLPMPSERFTSGGSGSQTAPQSRSLRGRRRRRASPWRKTAVPLSRRSRSKTPRYGFTTPKADKSGRFRWKVMQPTQFSHRMGKSCCTGS